MTHLLDTNIAIYLRDGDPVVTARIAALTGPVLLSIISLVELEGGVHREPREAGVRRARLDVMLDALPVLDFDREAADAYRMIVEVAGYSRRKILDRMIAAQALVHRAALVTRNAADFQDIPGLELIEW
ncbi:type II toxin-antitoxin system VapC family toxin [soil metagenome]